MLQAADSLHAGENKVKSCLMAAVVQLCRNALYSGCAHKKSGLFAPGNFFKRTAGALAIISPMKSDWSLLGLFSPPLSLQQFQTPFIKSKTHCLIVHS